MNFTSFFRHGLSALSMAMLIGVSAFGQTVATVPVGAVTVTIAAGTGTTRTVTPISFPLVDAPSGSGQLKGQITAITSNTISNSNAAWTAAGFSTSAIPYFIRITSGAASGMTFLISTSTSNTATVLTVDTEEAGLVNLTSSGLSVGDSYEILPCDTISSLFGTPATTGVVGGTTISGSGADIVYVMISGGWRQYYYQTSGVAGWKRVGLNSAADNVPVRPDSLVLYNRIGSTALNLVLTGQVPSIARKQILRSSGVTPLANPWPAGVVTLASSGISSISGWLSNAAYANADVVQIMVSGGWRQYFFDGVNWRRAGLNSISDTVQIPTGGGVILNKRGSATTGTLVSSSLPYSL